MNKYKILILSNMKGSGFKDDMLLKDSFEKDGNEVDINSVDYTKEDSLYDIIIRRNTWVSTEMDTPHLFASNQKLINR